MLLFIQQLAEEAIQKGIREGAFDDLEGKGKPLRFEDDAMVPEDCRMAYKILRNAGFSPPEIQDEKEIRTLLDLLEGCEDEHERYRQIQKLNLLVTRLNMRRKRPIALEANQRYHQRIVESVSVRRKDTTSDEHA